MFCYIFISQIIKKFPCVIFPDKYRYFPGNFRKKFAGNFPTYNPKHSTLSNVDLHSTVLNMYMHCKALKWQDEYQFWSFLLAFNTNLPPILPRFRDTVQLPLKSATRPSYIKNLGCSFTSNCRVRQMFKQCLLQSTQHADFDQPQPALLSVANPVRSTRWQIFFIVLRAQPLSRYAAIIAFAPKRCLRNVWIHISSANDTLPIINVTAENTLKEQ